MMRNVISMQNTSRQMTLLVDFLSDPLQVSAEFPCPSPSDSFDQCDRSVQLETLGPGRWLRWTSIHLVESLNEPKHGIQAQSTLFNKHDVQGTTLVSGRTAGHLGR